MTTLTNTEEWLDNSIITAQKIKNVIFEQLITDGKISKDDCYEYNEKWHIIYVKSKWFENIFKNGKDNWYIKYVKFES